jgi:hypothetical protein
VARLANSLDRARLVCLDHSDEVMVCESSRCAHSRKVYQQAIVARIESLWGVVRKQYSRACFPDSVRLCLVRWLTREIDSKLRYGFTIHVTLWLQTTAGGR